MQIKISHVISNNVKKYNFPLRRYQSLNFGSDSFELSSKKKEVNHTPFKKAKIANSAFGADFAFVLKMARLDNEKFSNVEKLVENDK